MRGGLPVTPVVHAADPRFGSRVPVALCDETNSVRLDVTWTEGNVSCRACRRLMKSGRVVGLVEEEE